MNLLTTAVAIVAAYLIGAIPFGYCFALWLKGVDIRTVGSGNIGATNVGRTFGFRYFLLIFGFDLGKGLLPTWGFPLLAARLNGQPAPPDLAVLVALATIMGHNYPVYLGFKGGKGVATSLGALLALDPAAGVASGVGFAVFLGVTGFVSLSSLLGGIVFVLVHFMTTKDPFSRGQLAMTLLTGALLVLLFVRHRANIGRILAGTEPKVGFGKKRQTNPSGKVALRLLLALAAIGGTGAFGLAISKRANHREVLKLGRTTLTETVRLATGHQRAERVVFADSGRLLAVTCPRYQRLVLYRVQGPSSVEPLRDIELTGQPIAVAASADKLYVLQRPPGDHRHIEPGWVETFDFEGRAVGDRKRVGFYPDDLALTPDRRHAVVLTSGRSEGGSNRPKPALSVFGLTDFREIGHLDFDQANDDPSRLSLSATGQCAAVTLAGSDVMASVDLFDPSRPTLIKRSPMARGPHASLSTMADDSIILPVLSGGDALRLPLAGYGEVLLCALPHDSGLELIPPRPQRSLGRLTLRSGSMNLGTVRPTGLAYSPELGLIAVANRSGGVHLVALTERIETASSDQGMLKR